MRFAKVLLILLVVFSIGLNVILYAKVKNRHPLFTINGDGLTKKDMDDYLEQQAGPKVKAVMAQRILVDQEAKKQGVTPSEKDIDEEFEKQKELNWQFAQSINSNPWLAGEARKQIGMELAVRKIRTKGVAVSDDEIKEEYNSNAALYDTPNKARTELAIILDASHVDDVRQLLEKPVSPAVIMQQFPARLTAEGQSGVYFIGNDNKVTFTQPFGNASANAGIFGLKPNAVKVLPPQEFARQGAKALVVRMLEIVPGKKADLNDPKIKEKITTAIALRRSKPWQEYLSTLWANTKFESEDPADKRLVENLLFPERARAGTH